MLTFVLMMKSPREIQALYRAIKAKNLDQRYTPPQALEDLMTGVKSQGIFTALGTSIQGREIGFIEIGTGGFKILAWSQMHGDESTATRALIDLFSLLNQNQYGQDLVASILETYTLRIIFQLNPDGAFAYSRENALGFDLNRDAVNQTQPESKLLNELVNEFQPDLCLNCHDQRSLYSLSNSVNPPNISFLSPAADEKLLLTSSRLKAMERIISAQSLLQDAGFDKIGRYDESYCANCFGDYLQSQKIPTVLIESGHIIGDEQREMSRYVVFLSLIGLLEFPSKQPLSQAEITTNYFDLPENQNRLRDVVLKNVFYEGKIVDLGLQNRFILEQGALKSETYIHDIATPGSIMGYKTQDLNTQEILINSHENDFDNKIIASIMLKKSGLLIKV